MTARGSLCGDKRGAALVEFALIAPVLLVLMLGMFDMGYNFYLQSQLQGAVQRAARDSTVQSAFGNTAAIDARVTEAVHDIVPDAEVGFSRRAYADFSDVRHPEEFTDLDSSGSCNAGEPFEDANGNGLWDRDRGASGGGGARDAIMYVVTVNYPRAFGAAKVIGLTADVSTEAITVLRNQPWDSQKLLTKLGNCA